MISVILDIGYCQYYTGLMVTRIRLLRERNGLTRKEISEAVGISPSYYSMLEYGTKSVGRLPLDKAIVLAEVLKCRPEELVR